MDELFRVLVGKYNYWGALVLLLIGLWGMIAKRNLLKKVIAMSIFQTAIILFYISIGEKRGATIPILAHGAGEAGHAAIDAAAYANPLPHVLMLTAIVVGVASTAVGLAFVVRIKEAYETVEEDEIVALDRAEDEQRLASEAREAAAQAPGGSA